MTMGGNKGFAAADAFPRCEELKYNCNTMFTQAGWKVQRLIRLLDSSMKIGKLKQLKNLKK